MRIYDIGNPYIDPPEVTMECERCKEVEVCYDYEGKAMCEECYDTQKMEDKHANQKNNY